MQFMPSLFFSNSFSNFPAVPFHPLSPSFALLDSQFGVSTGVSIAIGIGVCVSMVARCQLQHQHGCLQSALVSAASDWTSGAGTVRWHGWWGQRCHAGASSGFKIIVSSGRSNQTCCPLFGMPFTSIRGDSHTCSEAQTGKNA